MPDPYDRLRAWLTDRHVIDGAPLPAERVLAELLGCSRRQVRVALERAAGDGLLHQASARRRIVAQAPGVAAERTILVVHDVRLQPATGPYRPPLQRVLAGVVDAAAAHGCQAVTIPAGGRLRERVCALLRRRPLGLIILQDAVADPGLRALIDSAGHAGLVIVGRDATSDGASPATVAYDRVGLDHRQGVADLVAWAVAQGWTRLLRITGWAGARPLAPWRSQQEEGWRLGCERAGLAYQPSILAGLAVCSDPDDTLAQRVPALVGHLLAALRSRRPPQAILCAADPLVPDVVAACRRLGREPGRDLAILGYDDQLWDADLERRLQQVRYRPPVTVEPLCEVQGRMMVETVLAGRRDGPPTMRLAPMRVVSGTDQA